MNWLRRLIASAFPHACPEVDLHGMGVPEALAVVAKALDRARRDGASRLRIVCGKGKGSQGGVGVLRRAVPSWLEAHGYAGRYQREVDRDGRDGAIWVDVPPGQSRDS